jgi:hypothetical protein
MKKCCLIALSLVFLSACDDGGGSSTVSPEAAVQEYAQTYCAKMFSCCSPTEVYATEGECVTEIVERNTVPADAPFSYDADRLVDCLDYRMSELSGECTESIQMSSELCRNVVIGKSPTGGECSEISHCAPGNFCWQGICQAKVALGGSCAYDTDWICQEPLVCIHEGDTWTCSNAIPLGQACDWPADCGTEYDKTVWCIEGICAHLLANGVACQSPDDCASGYCDYNGTGACAPYTINMYCEDLSNNYY